LVRRGRGPSRGKGEKDQREGFIKSFKRTAAIGVRGNSTLHVAQRDVGKRKKSRGKKSLLKECLKKSIAQWGQTNLRIEKITRLRPSEGENRLKGKS